MAKTHLTYRNFHKRAIKQTARFFGSSPWQGGDGAQHDKFNRWLRDISGVYDIPSPSLEVRPIGDEVNGPAPMAYDPYRHIIILGRYSVLSLFIGFRLHMQAMGGVEGASAHDQNRDDAFGWGCSLFYSVRPKVFRKAVRQGQILGVDPSDLLHTGSTYVSPDEVRAPDDVSSLTEPVEPSEDDWEPSAGDPEDPALAERIEDEREEEGVDREIRLEAWAGHLAQSIAPTSVNQHVSVARRFLEFCDGAPDGPGAEELFAAFIEHAGASPSTTTKYRGILRKWGAYVGESTSV